ncbi:MAG: Obg family GTPase CgtA, partial [Oscillospiraceae bacterium]|nr:Obg family GTPase CgtA [Oscillospiraceae bacterium]
ADIPGLIEGAGEGAGLGFDFLRHIERCRLIVHVIDASGSEGRDPVEDFDTINAELRSYSERLAERPQIVAANKCDIVEDHAQVDRLREYVEAKGCRFFEISAAAHTGLGELKNAIVEELSKLPPVAVFEADYVEPEPVLDTAGELTIEHEDDYWFIEGPWLDRLASRVNFGDTESRLYFERTLRDAGVFDRLEELGIAEGDTVGLCGLEFEYRR